MGFSFLGGWEASGAVLVRRPNSWKRDLKVDTPGLGVRAALPVSGLLRERLAEDEVVREAEGDSLPGTTSRDWGR